MLEMEYMKLRQMEEYFKEMDTFVAVSYTHLTAPPVPVTCKA